MKGEVDFAQFWSGLDSMTFEDQLLIQSVLLNYSFQNKLEYLVDQANFAVRRKMRWKVAAEIYFVAGLPIQANKVGQFYLPQLAASLQQLTL